jgi:hypothetical protein
MVIRSWARVQLHFSQGTPPLGADGGSTNGTAVSLTPDRVGPVGEALREFGLPYPAVLGGLATFVVAESYSVRTAASAVRRTSGGWSDGRGSEIDFVPINSLSASKQ